MKLRELGYRRGRNPKVKPQCRGSRQKKKVRGSKGSVLMGSGSPQKKRGKTTGLAVGMGQNTPFLETRWGGELDGKGRGKTAE